MRWLWLWMLMVVPVAAAAAPGAVLVVGDSLSAAHDIPVNEGWVRRLQDMLAQAEPPREVINASISGATTQAGLAQLPELLAAHAPGIVILELGANDGLRGLPLAQIRANLDAMITASRTAGARVLLVGIELPVNYGARYREGLRRLYADLAREHDVALLPFLLEGVALDPQLMQADGLHPNAAGQARVFANVRAALLPLL